MILPTALYSHLTEYDLLISLKKSTPPENRKLIVYYYELKYGVNAFVGELTSKNIKIHCAGEILSLRMTALERHEYKLKGITRLVPDLENRIRPWTLKKFRVHSRAERRSPEFKNNHLTKMCSGSEKGSYFRRKNVCITQL